MQRKDVHWHRQRRREASSGSVPSEHVRHIGCAGGQQSARVSGVDGVLDPTTVVRVLGSRTGSRAFGTRRSSSCPQMVQWHAAQHLLAPAHRGEGAAFSARARWRSRSPNHTRACSGPRAAAAAGPTGARTPAAAAACQRGAVLKWNVFFILFVPRSAHEPRFSQASTMYEHAEQRRTAKTRRFHNILFF